MLILLVKKIGDSKSHDNFALVLMFPYSILLYRRARSKLQNPPLSLFLSVHRVLYEVSLTIRCDLNLMKTEIKGYHYDNKINYKTRRTIRDKFGKETQWPSDH